MDKRYRRDYLSFSLDQFEIAALVRIAEEAGELVQAATKTLKWGVYSYDPKDPERKLNLDRIQDEAKDVLESVSILMRHIQEKPSKGLHD